MCHPYFKLTQDMNDPNIIKTSCFFFLNPPKDKFKLCPVNFESFEIFGIWIGWILGTHKIHFKLKFSK